MIHWIRLQGPPGSQFRVQDPFPIPHDLPMLVALEAAADPGSIILWSDSEAGVAGLYHSLGRTAWTRSNVASLHAVVLRPGAGSGAAGLEIALLDGREAPVLVTRPFREEAAEWLEAQRERIGEIAGLEVQWRDYGSD